MPARTIFTHSLFQVLQRTDEELEIDARSREALHVLLAMIAEDWAVSGQRYYGFFSAGFVREQRR